MKRWNTEQLKNINALSDFDLTKNAYEAQACRIIRLFVTASFDDYEAHKSDYILFLNHKGRCVGVNTIDLELVKIDNYENEKLKLIELVVENEPFKVIIVRDCRKRSLDLRDTELAFFLQCRTRLEKLGVRFEDWINYDMNYNYISFEAENGIGKLSKRVLEIVV